MSSMSDAVCYDSKCAHVGGKKTILCNNSGQNKLFNQRSIRLRAQLESYKHGSRKSDFPTLSIYLPDSCKKNKVKVAQ